MGATESSAGGSVTGGQSHGSTRTQATTGPPGKGDWQGNLGKQPDYKGWAEVIAAVKSPLQIVVVVALVANAILCILAWRIDEKFVPLLFIVTLATLFVSIAAAVAMHRRAPAPGEQESPKVAFKYELFLAAPMAATPGDVEYQKTRADVQAVVNALKDSCGIESVYFAGKEMQTRDDFQPPVVSLRNDMKALKASRYFVVLHPKRQVTSTLYEAGMALAWGKPSIYFGRREDFPFLMQSADTLAHVRLYECRSAEEAVRVIKNSQRDLFP